MPRVELLRAYSGFNFLSTAPVILGIFQGSVLQALLLLPYTSIHAKEQATQAERRTGRRTVWESGVHILDFHKTDAVCRTSSHVRFHVIERHDVIASPLWGGECGTFPKNFGYVCSPFSSSACTPIGSHWEKGCCEKDSGLFGVSLDMGKVTR